MEDDKDLNTIEKKVELNEPKVVKKSFITFTKCNKYILFPFLSAILSAPVFYFSHLLWDNEIKSKNFFIIILNEISNIMVGLVYFIPCFMEKDNNNNDKNSNNNKEIKYIQSNIKNVNKKKAGFLFSIICIAYIINTIIVYNNQITGQLILFIVIFITIFSKLILKADLYKHHYLSFVIDIIGMVMTLIPTYLGFSTDILINYLYDLICGLCTSLMYVLIKYFSQVYYVSIFRISFLLGVVTTIFTIIGFIIYSLIKYHDLTFFKECFDFSEVDKIIIVYLLLILLFFMLSQLFTYLSLFNFSPTLLIITQIITPILFFILSAMYTGPTMPDIVICPIGYFIALFSSLVFNELIILNFCGLNKNTKKYVNERIKIELIDINNNQDDDDIIVEIKDKSDESKEYKFYID